jgi:hypothetical protein
VQRMQPGRGGERVSGARQAGRDVRKRCKDSKLVLKIEVNRC